MNLELVKSPLRPLWGKTPWRISRRNEELKQLLQTAETNVDFWFRQSMGNYIENELLPRARNVLERDYPGPSYVKTCRSRYKSFNGLSTFQNFILELDCLSLINSVTAGEEPRHFPRLIDFDVESRSITMSHQGTSVDRLTKRVVVPDFEAQVSRMLQVLHDAQVVHLDMNPSGRNLLVDERGILSIIDFDCAVALERPFSESYRARVNTYRTTEDRIVGVCEKHEFLLVS
jgi:hypothetical protein